MHYIFKNIQQIGRHDLQTENFLFVILSYHYDTKSEEKIFYYKNL